jgi:hypothetical protein
MGIIGIATHRTRQTDFVPTGFARAQIVVGGNGSCAEDSFKISASAPICNGSGSVSLSAKPNYRPRCVRSGAPTRGFFLV